MEKRCVVTGKLIERITSKAGVEYPDDGISTNIGLIHQSVLEDYERALDQIGEESSMSGIISLRNKAIKQRILSILTGK